jgi:hypothetical protein
MIKRNVLVSQKAIKNLVLITLLFFIFGIIIMLAIFNHYSNQTLLTFSASTSLTVLFMIGATITFFTASMSRIMVSERMY